MKAQIGQSNQINKHKKKTSYNIKDKIRLSIKNFMTDQFFQT